MGQLVSIGGKADEPCIPKTGFQIYRLLQGSLILRITKICHTFSSLTKESWIGQMFLVVWEGEDSGIPDAHSSFLLRTYSLLLPDPPPALLMFCVNAALFLVSNYWKQRGHSVWGRGWIEYDTQILWKTAVRKSELDVYLWVRGFPQIIVLWKKQSTEN